jgi:hypothetical protein
MKLVGMKDDLVNGKEGAHSLIWGKIGEFFKEGYFFLPMIRKTLRID